MVMRWCQASALAALSVPQFVGATVYLDVAQAQQILFPEKKLTHIPMVLSAAQQNALRADSGVREPFKGERIWRAAEGGYFIIDEVVGKHEMIKYAVALSADGVVRGIEIMEYNETYGGEVRQASWRAQFVGKGLTSPVKLNVDIKNISGATLSCKHVTDGVKRILAVYGRLLRGSD